MLVISLTSIPPRFGQLPRVLAALLAQQADRVVLVVPQTYARFDTAPLPELPGGVTLLQSEEDMGPAGKLLPAARAYPKADILCCDDDWLYGPDWTNAFRAARQTHGKDAVLAGSSWPTERIHRAGGTIVQGFSGVMIAARHAARIPEPTPEAWVVDDVWMSGHVAAQGLAIKPVPEARAALTPLAAPGALQDTTPRDAANRATADYLHETFGIWPEICR